MLIKASDVSPQIKCLFSKDVMSSLVLIIFPSNSRLPGIHLTCDEDLRKPQDDPYLRCQKVSQPWINTHTSVHTKKIRSL
mmetsp:Transcript_6418/g.9365  ORF Transcript_6418/g.9365 Transcript_6418/m.9365 type:complete len:80 (-) Transcript_6418:1105-1344(-)